MGMVGGLDQSADVRNTVTSQDKPRVITFDGLSYINV